MTTSSRGPGEYPVPDGCEEFLNELLQQNWPPVPNVQFSNNSFPKVFVQGNLIIIDEDVPTEPHITQQQIFVLFLSAVKQLFDDFQRRGIEFKCLPNN